MTDRPNIVLVTVDSLRADHCGCYGYGRDTTPTLDAMAANGTIFENALAPGTSTPTSMPAIFTGQYSVERTGTGADGLQARRSETQAHMACRDPLPERLSRRGYSTAGFTPNPWTARHFGFDRGFDRFEDFLEADRSSGIWERMIDGKSSKSLTAVRLLSSWLQRENTFKPWEAFVDDAVSWANSASEPYFLWLFLLDTHFPYFSGDADRTQARWRTYEANLRLYLEDQDTPYSPRVHDQLVTAYDDAVRYVDRCLTRLEGDLSDDEPAIVVHADHGEGFGEHGTYGHHAQLHEPNIHVPLVLSGAGSQTVSNPISLRRLPELVTGLADGTLDRGIDELPRWSAVWTPPRTAVRGRAWKYVRDVDSEALYRIDDGEESAIENETLRTVSRGLCDHAEEAQAESARTSAAAGEVATGGEL